ncbi:fimbrial protein [Morganella psychrotolerans]|nr:fimbrial-like protein [Morganella psychrotolerans]
MMMTPELRISALATMLFLSLSTARAGSNSQVINFNATFYGGSCEVTAPAELPFADGAPVADDSIAGDKRFRQFSVTLSGCQGYFMAPKLSVSGNTITGSGGTKLFADAASTTKGYGIRLATDGNTRFEANNNTAANGLIKAKNWPAAGSDTMTLLNSPLEFKGYLSCGTCTPASGLQGGELKATVTFAFLYN